jgi:hypothetical protein
MDAPLALTKRLTWGVGSALLLVIGSLGAWATFGPFSVAGTSGDGVITLIAGLVAGVLIVLRRFTVVTLLAGLVAVATAIYDTATISDSGNEFFSASVGWGLILADLAAVSLIAWAVAELVARRRAPQADEPAEAAPAAI